MEATVIMATCYQSKKTFGIRSEKTNGTWHFTWAFSMDKSVAKREGYDSTTVKGSIVIDSDYPGCPYCKSGGFVQCGNCQNMVCWDNKNTQFKCPDCGNQGEVTVAESFDNIKGSGY